MAAETAAVALVLAVAVYAVVQFKDAGLVAAVLTFLGVLLTAGAKQLLEHRSDQRLRLDAAMRAGALLTPTKDAPVSSAAAASGLLALTELGRSDLAVALLSVSKETAVLVINAALKSGATQPSAPLVAAELLCRHDDTLDPCQSLHWPSVLDGGWIPEVGPKTKLLLVEALVSMSVAADPSPNALRSADHHRHDDRPHRQWGGEIQVATLVILTAAPDSNEPCRRPTSSRVDGGQ